MNYEDSVIRLEKIISELENNNNNISFDESVKMYEEAATIIKNTYEILKNAKGKIVEINEKLEEIDFD